MKGLKLMYSYKTKILGVAVSALGIIGMIAERITPVIFNKKWNAGQHYGFFVWVMFVGLLTIAYCRERYDDERAQLVRLKAFQISFMIMMALLLSMAFAKEAIRPPDLDIDGMTLYYVAGLGIIGYLLTFYSGLYLDRFWDFDNKDKTILQNLRDMPKNIGGIMIYLLVFTITLLVLTFISS